MDNTAIPNNQSKPALREKHTGAGRIILRILHIMVLLCSIGLIVFHIL